MTNLQTDIRALRTDELDAVTGGIINGCLRLPTFVEALPFPIKPFVDVFAKKVPSWAL